jgi:hypothetical protein
MVKYLYFSLTHREKNCRRGRPAAEAAQSLGCVKATAAKYNFVLGTRSGRFASG